MNPFLRFTALTVVVSTLLLGCNNRTEPTVYDDASSLLDRGAYSQAIAAIEPELERRPNDLRLRVLLASAYAGRAGVTMRGYVHMAQRLSESMRLAKKIFGRARNETPVMQFVDELYEIVIKVKGLSAAFELIPVPRGASAVADLETAIEILSQDDRLAGGSALYRGLLRLSIFKINLRDKYSFADLSECEIDTGSLRARLRGLRIDLGDIFADVAIGTAKKQDRAKIQRLARDIEENLKRLSDLFAGFSEGQTRAAIAAAHKRFGGRCI